MSGGAKRSVKGAAPHARPPAADKPAADKRLSAAAPDPPAKAAPKSPPARAKKSGSAASDDARQDALSEARDMAETVANNDEGNTNTTPPASPPPVPRKADHAVTLELNKEKAERAKLQAETELLRKELDDLVKEKKRKESVAAEPAPPAKRAVGSGRRSVPQSAAI
jgi:RNA polymerase primary sigma factor